MNYGIQFFFGNKFLKDTSKFYFWCDKKSKGLFYLLNTC